MNLSLKGAYIPVFDMQKSGILTQRQHVGAEHDPPTCCLHCIQKSAGESLSFLPLALPSAYFGWRSTKIPSWESTNLFIFLTLGGETRISQASHATLDFLFLLETLRAVLGAHLPGENLYEAFQSRFLCLMVV